jgi:hypothetical protein
MVTKESLIVVVTSFNFQLNFDFSFHHKPLFFSLKAVNICLDNIKYGIGMGYDILKKNLRYNIKY